MRVVSTPATSLLDRILSQRVVLQLKDGRTLAGRLTGVDEHLNLVLEEVEETSAGESRRLGRVVLRGSSVTSLHAPGGAAGRSS